MNDPETKDPLAGPDEEALRNDDTLDRIVNPAAPPQFHDCKVSDFARAQSYLAKIPAASEGGRNDALNSAAFALAERFALSQTEFESILAAWAARCSPPLPPIESSKTIRSAWNGATRKGVAGQKRSVRYTYQGQPDSPARPAVMAPAPATAPAKAKQYDLTAPGAIPPALASGCKQFLLACFEPGEGVAIAQEVNNDDGKGIPKNGGVVLSREVWLEKLDKAGGDPNKIFATSEKNGAFVRVNPMKDDGEKDVDVTAFRHALLEFDKISVAEQWQLIQQSGVPCAAVIHSGNKSIHAWVKIDARDRQEYNSRVAALYEHFAGYIETDAATGKEVDRVRANKNPSRFSRLPGMVRGKNQQTLLAVNHGSESFLAWMLSNNMDAFSRPVSVQQMKDFRPLTDPDCLLGQRWLCKGGSCLWVGQSGIGKSSLNMQAAITWAAGRPLFGIIPKRKLKSLIIQAENDLGDLAEMFQGVMDAMTAGKEEAYNALETDVIANCHWETVADRFGAEFLSGLAILIDKHKPDLCWLDPLLAFVGDDISKQTVCSQFLRVGLAKIAKATGVTWMLVHHTGKPPKDPAKNQKAMTDTDWAYQGFGSSELVNWARAVCVLRDMGEQRYNLKLAKRGLRAQAKDFKLEYTIDLMLKHAPAGISWHQCTDKDAMPHSVKKVGREKKFAIGAEFLKSIEWEEFTHNALIRKIMENQGCGDYTAKNLFKDLLAAKILVKDEESKTYSVAKNEPKAAG